MIEWDDVRIFHAAIRAGDYSSAGRRLGVNRTTIGRRVSRLERATGLGLWEQTTEGPRPSARGKAVLRAAEAMERAMEQLVADLNLAAPLSGPIRLAGTTGIAALLMPELSAFRTVHPDVAIEVIAARDAIEALHQRHADLGIAIANAKPRDLAGLRVGRIEQALYVQRGANPDSRIGWGYSTLLANPQPWARLNAVSGSALACEVDTLQTMVDALHAGMGAGWLWTFIGDAQPDLVRLQTASSRAATADLWLLRREGLALESSAEKLMNELHVALTKRIST